ncbi:MAG TPA: hypothetical protein VEO01_26715 [Pseudonocardiaceae bacterium]|nr:hypothetical protein [Pseudonocardiaceae bacterium]
MRATKKPVVVLAGEDRNDRKSLRILLEAFVPEMRGRIVEISDKVRLRQANGHTLDERVDALANKVSARAAREHADVACVFVHEDLDAVDGPEYQTTRKRVQAALDRRFHSAHYMLAVWEVEAWLLLFPEALTAFNRSWKIGNKYRNKDTGLLADPKALLANETNSGPRSYRESDAPEILAKAIALGCHLHTSGSNRSWSRAVQDADQCGSSHLVKKK